MRSLLALEGLEVAAEVEQASGLEAALAANPCDILLLVLQMEQWSMDQISDLSRKTAIIVLTANESVETRTVCSAPGSARDRP
jgi:DNA-binding response OmpR family regulator